MRKRLTALLLSFVMLLTMLPVTVSAEGAEETGGGTATGHVLDISYGDITITNGGFTYYVAEDTDATQVQEKTYNWVEGEERKVTIMGSSAEDLVNKKPPYMITIKGGTTEITLDNVSITADHSGGKTQNYKPGINFESGSATLTLKGKNTIQATYGVPGITIHSGASLTIVGDGALKVASGACSPAIGGIDGNNGGMGSLTVKSGTLELTARYKPTNGVALGSNKAGARVGTITLEGGIVTANGKLCAENFTMSGGTLNVTGSHDMGTVQITGGNTNGGVTDTTRKERKILFADAEGNALTNTTVTVTEGGHTWNAVTDAQGIVTTCLDNATTTISATVGGATYNDIAVANSTVLVGVTCICPSKPGSVVWSDMPETMTLYDGKERTIAVDATYQSTEECKVPFHPGYEVTTVEVKSVTVDGVAAADASAYAVYNAGTLTLKNSSNPYTVTLRAVVGTTGITSEKQVAVIGSNMQAFDLMAGDITAESGADGKVKYTQNTTVVETADAVAVYGTGKTDNALIVKSGHAKVVLDGVNIEATTNISWVLVHGPIQVLGGTLDLTLKGANQLKTEYWAPLIYVGAQDSTDPKAAVLNIYCTEKDCKDTEACPDSLRCTAKNSGNALIGTVCGEKGVRYAGTINVNGGKLILEGGQTGIGTGSLGTNAASYCYDLNFNGGYVKYYTKDRQAIGIGAGRGSAGNMVNINIMGGTLDIDVSVGESAAIGATSYATGTVNINIGTEGGNNDQPNIKAKGASVAIGRPGNSNVDMNIQVKSGTVYAEGRSGIGFAADGHAFTGNLKSSLKATGGDITAIGTENVGFGAQGRGNYNNDDRSTDYKITVGGSAKLTATGAETGIGISNNGKNDTVDIRIEGNATVDATATDEGGVAIGSKEGAKIPKEELRKDGVSLTVAETATVSAKSEKGEAIGDATGTLDASKLPGNVSQAKGGQYIVEFVNEKGEAQEASDYVRRSGKDMHFRIRAGKDQIAAVTTSDGTVLGEHDYAYAAGILTLRTTYLDKLKDGTYALTVTFAGGKAAVSFTVNGGPTPGSAQLTTAPEGVTVDGLDKVAQAKAAEIRMSIEATGADGDAQRAISTKAGSRVQLSFYEMTVLADGSPLSDIGTVIAIKIPFQTAGRTITVYRYHGSEAQTLTKLDAVPAAPADGTYFVGDGYVMIYSSQFSTYAIGYTETASSGGRRHYTGTPGAEITGGADQTKRAGDIIKVTAKSDGAKVSAVYVDGALVDGKYYIVSGNAVKLQGTYTATLSQGTHTLRVVYTNGAAVTTTFVLKGTTSPHTGDPGVGIYLASVVLSIAGSAYVFRKKKNDD